MARPRVEIDWKKFDALCKIQCTLAEIAGVFECSEDTIERAVKRDKKQGFADYYKKKSAGGKMSLRRWQFSAAENGNTSMLIFLGKQYLGQAEKLENDNHNEMNDGFVNAMKQQVEDTWQE